MNQSKKRVYIAYLTDSGLYTMKEGYLVECNYLHINISKFLVNIDDQVYELPRNILFSNSEDCCKYIENANGGLFN